MHHESDSFTLDTMSYVFINATHPHHQSSSVINLNPIDLVRDHEMNHGMRLNKKLSLS